MINTAEKEGKITPQTTIIEPTSGNTGVGLALICSARGYKIKLVMPESMSEERRRILKALGAELILTPANEGMLGAVTRAQKLVDKNKNYFMPQQFENPANPEAHRQTTGPEIWEDTDGEVDFFVAGVGTGGTLTGTCGMLKEKKPSVQAIAVEPAESAVLSGEKPGPHGIQGIGAGFVPKVLNRDIIDEIVKVKSDDAIKTGALLAKSEGIFCGISSGANVWAAMQIAAREENRGKTIVAIICDTGERYLSTGMFS
jgi:cysteine synthase A